MISWEKLFCGKNLFSWICQLGICFAVFEDVFNRRIWKVADIILLCLRLDFIGGFFIVFLFFNFGQRHVRCFEKESD